MFLIWIREDNEKRLRIRKQNEICLQSFYEIIQQKSEDGICDRLWQIL